MFVVAWQRSDVFVSEGNVHILAKLCLADNPVVFMSLPETGGPPVDPRSRSRSRRRKGRRRRKTKRIMDATCLISKYPNLYYGHALYFLKV